MRLKATAFPSVFRRAGCGRLIQVLQNHFQHWRSALLMMILAFGLTGCLDAQTRIQFDTPHRGQLVQSIQLGSQLAAAQDWLNQLETRAKQLDGKVQRPSPQALLVTLPFTNAADLETKFNQLVSSPPQSAAGGEMIPALNAHLQVNTSNLLLLQRNHLIYDIDLTSLGLQSATGDVLFNTGDVMTLSFGLTGPWGAGGPAVDQQQDGQAMWSIKPGQTNHIEATLWMPNPIGLGTVAIVGLVVAGTYYIRKSA